MDRQAVLGFVLIFAVLMVWMWMSAPQPQPAEQPAATEAAADTPQIAPRAAVPVQLKTDPSDVGRFFEGRQQGRETVIIIETDLFTAELTSRGGLIKKWELREFQTWDGQAVQLVDMEKGGDFSLLFGTTDGKLVNTRELFFDASYRAWERVRLEGDGEYRVEFVLPAANGGRIIKSMVFRNGRYGFRTSLRFVGMQSVISNYQYQVMWEHGLRYAEQNSVDESRFAAAYAYAGGELTELDAATIGEVVSRDLGGQIDWIATRSKYFSVAVIPSGAASEGAYLEGTARAVANRGIKESYAVALKVPFRGLSDQLDSLEVFFGPLDYSILSEYDIGLENMMSLGWAWIIRPISTYIVLPLFKLINLFVPNWGVVLIIFAIIVKIALHPLTKTSMKSMQKMQALQPMIEELRAKYKDEPQKMNQQMMALYKEYGVNPAGGCLPLLLQFPILIALYNVFMSAIELRQASFIWWITDLSVPDTIFSLPFELPVFGIRDVSGLALLMGITTFIQQKMSVKDPRQKAMIYVMPILLTLLFNSFPSGLNLYYFMFNLLAIGQQIVVNRQHADEPLRKVEPKKKQRGGIFGKYAKDMPRLKK